MKRLIPLAAVCLLGMAGTAQGFPITVIRTTTITGPHAHKAPELPAAATCPAGVPTQAISVVNQANVRPSALAKVERAMVEQSMQLRAAWGTPCVQFAAGGWTVTLTPGATTVNPDGSTSTTIGGNHFYSGGTVSAAVQTGGTSYQTWARAFSHEIDEALVDPTLVTSWKFGRLEVCDPVENWTYQLDGVQLSDFALPSYFNGDGAAPWDQAGQLTGPSGF